MAAKEKVEEEKNVRNEAKPEQVAVAEKENVTERLEMTMKPWEQHSAVISIPRFDYNAPSALLQRSHSGFLITCTIKREKSATKEAISILEKHVGLANSCKSECLDACEEHDASKRRKICIQEIDDESSRSVEISESDLPKGTCTTSETSDTVVHHSFALSLVKLTRSGLLLFTFAKGTSSDTVRIVSNVIRSLESGRPRSSLWCHRIFPIQETCCLNEKDLQAVVSKLVLKFWKDKQDTLPCPVKFAVGYNRRGMEETETKTRKDQSDGSSDANVLLDRNKCFSIVAAAVKDIISDAVVDLKSPELSVLVELLPISGVPLESSVVGVSVLPSDLVSTKPKLGIKALVSATTKSRS